MGGGVGKLQLVKGLGPLQGVRQPSRRWVSQESTWCIVRLVQSSLGTGSQQDKEEPATPAWSLPGAATSVGFTRHTPSAHTPSTSLPRFHFREY